MTGRPHLVPAHLNLVHPVHLIHLGDNINYRTHP